MIDCHARPFSTCCGCPTPLHCSFDTTSALHSRRGWLSRPPSAAAPRVSWPLMPDQFRVCLILRARQQTTGQKRPWTFLPARPILAIPFRGRSRGTRYTRRPRRTRHQRAMHAAFRDIWSKGWETFSSQRWPDRPGPRRSERPGIRFGSQLWRPYCGCIEVYGCPDLLPGALATDHSPQVQPRSPCQGD